MLTHFPFTTLGSANYGWLNAKYHFSFADYSDPAKMSFGELLVINDDRIAPHKGFDTHSHSNMEIITYVRRGAITHRDSQGNAGRTEAGSVQVMSAGSGIAHSEFNLEDDETNIYQIWIIPKTKDIPPRWDTAEFPRQPVTERMPLLVSGDGSAPLQIHQDARIYAGKITAESDITHPINGQAYLLISDGAVRVNDLQTAKGDGIAVTGEQAVTLHTDETAEVLIIEVPGLRRAR